MSSPPQTGTPVQTPSASATVRTNASAATAAAGGGQGKCDFCSRVGLPILPLRYAAVPAYIPGAVANPVGWAQLGANLKGQHPDALKGHRYALRTLRKGYVMVYLGSGLWHAYVVSAGGHLRKLADIDDPDFKNDREMSEACARAGHNIPASFITIPPIAHGRTRMLPTKVWIAFSDVLWTREVRKQYEQRAAGASKMRGLRFQSFMTDALGKQADGVADAFQLSQDEATTTQRLNGLVVEYAADAAQAGARTQYDAIDPYDAKKRNRIDWESAHGISMRTAEAPGVAKHASKLTPSNKEQLMASAVVLDDPVGMVQELNVTRLKTIESRQRYLSDPRIARPLLISQSIMGLKQMIGEQTLAAMTEEEKGLPDVQEETIYSMPDGIPMYTETTTRQERADKKAGSLWSSLQEHYRESERAAFEKAVASTVKNFQDWLVKTDADYAQWLGHADWVLRCRDFDPKVPEQQDRLHEVMAVALRGGPSGTPVPNPPPGMGPQDSRVYEVWKKFFGLPPTDEANPIYVALFGFDENILDYLLPEGPNPLDDKIHKGSKLYKVIKTIIGTKELTSDTMSGIKANGASGILSRDAASKVPNPVRVAGASAMGAARSRITKATGPVAESMLAIGGALNRMAADAVTEVAQATVMRAVQGAVLLYERREIYLVTSRIRVRDYLAYLNDIAFKAGDSAIDAGMKVARSVTQAGKNTVRSMAIAGALHIGDKKVADAFIDVVHWVYGGLDDATKAIDAMPADRQAARTAHEAAQAATAAEIAAMGAAMRVHPFTLSPEASAFVETVSARARSAGVGAGSVLKTMTRTSLRLVSTGSGILAVGSLVVQGWSLKDNVKKADATFLASNEARVLVISASIATFGATVELVGVSGKLLGAGWGTAVGRVGGVIGAAASIVEGIQASMASHRTYSHGDYDAATLYALAGGALIAGGMVGGYGALTGAALLGPIGWALILIAVGVALLYFAMRAEDSQTAIWLDRCYWGKGKRFQRGHIETDRPWSNQEVDQELSQLNAIIIGLSGETGFNDDGWGFTSFVWDTVKAKITFPNYDPQASAFEWQLRAVSTSKHLNIMLASGKHQTVPDDPDAIVVRGALTKKPALIDTARYFRNVVGPTMALTGPNKNLLVVEVSVEVRVEYFSDVALTADYVAELSDPRARASLSLSEND